MLPPGAGRGPNHPETLNNLGIVLRDQERYDEAAACYRQALERKPGFLESLTNLGNILRDLGRYDESAAYYRRSIERKPAYPEGHSNLAQILLLQGDFAGGLAEYDWRWQVRGNELPAYPQPLWDGSPLAGRTILLHPEQGLGDTLQFIRYAALVKERRRHGDLPLSRRRSSGCCGAAPASTCSVPATPAPPPFDLQARLMSLPRLFGTTVATIPAPVPVFTGRSPACGALARAARDGPPVSRSASSGKGTRSSPVIGNVPCRWQCSSRWPLSRV